jgi:hypothetical protein
MEAEESEYQRSRKLPAKKSGAGRPKKNSDGNSDGNSQPTELASEFNSAGNSERISKAS